ncbi:armadillo-type protein [Scheffersomyces coipomensis]|uniref:armadillo-type protein n=1 Tax=Scheffersomyces coipomensis TaxID=1788519 RepID=UPI00315D92EE
MSDEVIKLIIDQNSSDNNVRTLAELEFNKLSAENPSQILFYCIQIAGNENLPIDIRQATLLHIKRLVPKYWSLGFQSFVGPPVNQDIKATIRKDLLTIATSSPNSKLRSGSAYSIVQIASVEYPDEWPDLLTYIYGAASNFDNEISMLGGLTVLNDLFDDLITEEQFWGGVGTEVSNYIFSVLEKDSISSETKSMAVKLYQSVVTTLLGLEGTSNNDRKQYTINHIKTSIPILLKSLKSSFDLSIKSSNVISLQELYLRSNIYLSLTTILSSLSSKIQIDLRKSILEVALNDVTYISEVFQKVVVLEQAEVQVQATSELNDPENLISIVISELLRTISVLQVKLPVIEGDSNRFSTDLINLSILPSSTTNEYDDDLNLYITEITGLSINASPRESIYELVSEINDADAAKLFIHTFQSLGQTDSWIVKEASLYILEALFSNEDSEIINNNESLLELLNRLSGFISDTNFLVSSRAILLLPKFFEKFESRLSVSTIGIKTFTDTISVAAQDSSSKFIKVSTLVSLTYYNQFINFNENLPNEVKEDIQLAIFRIVFSLIDDCEEDGLAPLLEAITVAIDIDPHSASSFQVVENVTVADLIFRIAFKDPANVQLNVDSSDGLSTLLKNISEPDYIRSCEKSLPFILDLLKEKISQTSTEYSPELYLSLELLSVIIDAPSFDLPSQLFYYTFPLLRRLILQTSDNQILQNAGEVLINLLKRASKLFLDYKEDDQSGMDYLLNILSKFLSPELGDSAASNCGTIIFTFINEFQTSLSSEFIFQILEATVNRLIVAKEPITIENLIMVFCKLVLNSPEGMIDFLYNMKIESKNQNGLEVILPIWFESFEVTRGYEKILQNSLALAKIFTLQDKRVESLVVNGDIIPYEGDLIITRSRALSMPERYTQIPASLKILKLLVSELTFQNQQPNASDYLPEEDQFNDDDGDEEGWEDMDDIGVPNYEKLKSYVDSDNDEPDAEDNNSGDLKAALVSFFKECTSKNLGDFQKYYNSLDEDEKKTITENILF